MVGNGWYFGGALLAVVVLFCSKALNKKRTRNAEPSTSVINVSSASFKDGETLPSDCTCDGKNVSPPISWSNIPANTKSVVLIHDDPDAPGGTWVHWILFNIPPQINFLAEGVDETTLDAKVRRGRNSWENLGYGGACPPSGTHRYIFKIYAIDTILNLENGATKEMVLGAMKGHILGEGKLISKYSRSNTR